MNDRMFQYNTNIYQPTTNNVPMDLGRPDASRDMNNSKKNNNNNEKFNQYTFTPFMSQQNPIPHPLDKQTNEPVNRKSNCLDFSKRMTPNTNIPHPINSQNPQYNPVFDRLPMMDTFNQSNN
jgi:hypothetical protein